VVCFDHFGSFTPANLTRILAKISNSHPHASAAGHAEQKPKQGTHSFQDSLLPNQQEEAFEQAFREAAIGLVLAPLDDRMKIRLIELDYVIEDTTVTNQLIQRVRQLREGDRNINHYLDSLVSDRGRN